MKQFRSFLAWCLVLIVLGGCCGCARNESDLSMETIAMAYRAAGYSVSCKWYDEPLDEGQIGYLQADHPDGDYIYFSFFASEEDAEQYKDTYYHPGAMWLFSVIYGEPAWPQWRVYGSIVAEYDDRDLLEPLNQLMR